MDTSLMLIVTSVDGKQAAESLARGLIDAHLAACVQISADGISIYRWQGRIERAGEKYLSIKTTAGKLDDALTWLSAHHPYEAPELIWWPVHADAAYAAWAHEAITPEA